MLHDFFDDDGTQAAKLYLSDNGSLLAVQIDEAGSFSFEEAAAWGKWSELDALTFPGDPVVEPVAVAEAADAAVNEALVAGVAGEEVSTQALGLGLAQVGLGGLGSVGTAEAAALGGAAVLGSAAFVLAGGDNGISGGGDTARVADPTVDQANASYSFGGSSALMVRVSGTAEPGAWVEVRIGDEVLTVRADENGIWRAAFSADAFPADGAYEAVVTVTNPDGSVVVLGGPAVLMDTVAPDVDAGGNVGMGGTWINAETADGGITLSGTGEPGAEFLVALEGIARHTTVSADGTWSVYFSEGELPDGEYATEVTVTATDAFGNQTVRSETLAIDTVAPDLAFGTIEGDNVVNAAEHADGVAISGIAEPSASVEVSFEGSTHETLAREDGTWSVDFEASEIPEGQYDGTLTVTITDIAGNTASETVTVPVDTTAFVAFAAEPVAGDGVVNLAEAGGGLVLTGATFPGSTVTVTDGNHSYATDVAADGRWSATGPAAHLPSGEMQVRYTASAVSAAGNASSAQIVVGIDAITDATLATPFMGDDVVNGAERAGGVTLTGFAEPGSTVQVTLAGTTLPAIVAADGAWSATFLASVVPGGETSVPVSVTATDAAGNSTTTTGSVQIDTMVRGLATKGARSTTTMKSTSFSDPGPRRAASRSAAGLTML